MVGLDFIAKNIGIDYIGEDKNISGINTLLDAKEDEISFYNSSKYIDSLSETKASAVLIEEKYAHLLPSSTIALITDEPYLKLALASKLFAYKIVTKGGHPHLGDNCDIDKRIRFGKNVTIGDNVTILAGCYIGDNVIIGSNTLLHSNVSVYYNSTIGEDCIIHSGTVIGSDGYGFAHTKDGEHIKIYQNGIAEIGDRVEIGANCTIDRAVFGKTIIRSGTKLDNLIQIGHNSDIGENNIMASQVGISGSTTLGRNVIMAGQSGTAGHISIGDFTTITARGGVTKSLDGNKIYGGFPAIEHKKWLKLQAKISSLLKIKK
ncbi:UDP-3-O-[3-hydroxymyristoyl] glucosamine N-acyltransferase [hydrothermal vent metagenome]|uniref:UDP-3-O-[3-hydroxymyristoyl] glucosamine N-acyltransferase n=1 Tax=hydrothermal vent metagenome TaxID=652676 RepID=A0A1W1BPZ7_9ZZZZ